MSNYYPEGSMRGSGIYSKDVTISVTCDECDYEWDEDFATDDWGNVDTDVTCPSCSGVFGFAYDMPEPEPDYDAMYKESRMD